jgi:hypothetical protein
LPLLSLLTSYQQVHKYNVNNCIVGGIITEVKRFCVPIAKYFRADPPVLLISAIGTPSAQISENA